MSAKTTDEMLAALGWVLIDDGTAENKRSTPEAVDKTGAIRISDRWPSKGVQPFYTIFEVDGEFPSFALAVEAAYKRKFPDPDFLDEVIAESEAAKPGFAAAVDAGVAARVARRELTAKKLDGQIEERVAQQLKELGWKEGNTCGFTAVDSKGVRRIWSGVEYWCLAGEDGKAAPEHRGYDHFWDAVDAAHKARFPQAELNRPIEYADPDHCQTSELDLARAEVEQLKAALKEQGQLTLHWLDNAQTWQDTNERLREELATANAMADSFRGRLDVVNQQLTARNQEYESMKDAHRGLLNRQPVATFDGKEWRSPLGAFNILLAHIESDTQATIDRWGVLNAPTTVHGRYRADTIALVNNLLAFRGIRVQE